MKILNSIVSFGRPSRVTRDYPRVRVQWIPNFIHSEKRLCLTRIRWENGKPGFGGYSSKLSISLCLAWLPIRIKLVRSYGGMYP